MSDIPPPKADDGADARLVTECCGVSIDADHRYCPKCGYEARVEKGADARQVSRALDWIVRRCAELTDEHAGADAMLVTVDELRAVLRDELDGRPVEALPTLLVNGVPYQPANWRDAYELVAAQLRKIDNVDARRVKEEQDAARVRSGRDGEDRGDRGARDGRAAIGGADHSEGRQGAAGESRRHGNVNTADARRVAPVPTYGDGLCKCGHLSSQHDCDHDNGEYGCFEVDCRCMSFRSDDAVNANLVARRVAPVEPLRDVLEFVESHIAPFIRAGDEYERGWQAAMHNVRNRILEAQRIAAPPEQERNDEQAQTIQGEAAARVGAVDGSLAARVATYAQSEQLSGRAGNLVACAAPPGFDLMAAKQAEMEQGYKRTLAEKYRDGRGAAPPEGTLDARDVTAAMEDYLRGTDNRDPRHIITAHWLSRIRAAAGVSTPRDQEP
jgi:hypothetical protein